MKNYRSSGMLVTVQGANVVKFVVSMLLFLMMIFSISGLLTSLKPEYRISSNSVNLAANNLTGEVLFQLMGWENHHFLNVMKGQASKPKMTNLMFQLSANINLDDPRSLLGRELPGFSLFDGRIIAASEDANYTNMPIESAPPIDIMKAEREAALQNLDDVEIGDTGKDTAPPSTTGERKVVYVYFTHTRESYLPYLKGVTDPNSAYHSQINVTKIGDKLKESMESKGIGTSVDKTDVMSILNNKGLGYGDAYRESRPVVQQAMAGNRELQYIIDIHRDSRRKKETTQTINGQSFARLAFVIGAEHSNYEKNLALAKELHDRLNAKYPGLSRSVIEKQGKETNGKFNQDLSGNAILIEFGGVDNTFEELYRSAEALADVFSEYYWQAEKVSAPANGN
jgi:stage II sporulation protein P